MTRLENELRTILNVHAPDGVDTTGWADAARFRAARTRRRAGTAVVAAAVVAAGITTIAVLSTGRPHAGPPAKPVPPTASDQTLCAFDGDPGYGQWGPADAAPSTVIRAIALCPDDPADPAWAWMPEPAVLHGSYVDRVSTAGGPPVENCELGRPALPPFRVVTVTLDGDTHSSYASAGMRCGGAQTAQSFAAGLAEQRYDATHPARRGCVGTVPLDSIATAANLERATAVHVCVTGDPYVEAEPAPVRYRPLVATQANPAQRQVLLDGLARSGTVRGRYTDCPWRHVAIRVITTMDAGQRSAVLLRCEQDYSGGTNSADKLATMRGSWPSLPGEAQALLEAQARTYLNGRADN